MSIIYFTAEWCAPCKQLKPMVLSSGKSILIVDVDSNKPMADKYGIKSVPTLLVINGDVVSERYSGTAQIMEFLKR